MLSVKVKSHFDEEQIVKGEESKMIQVILSVILIISLVSSVLVVIKKRKKDGITGIRSALTSICFLLIGVTALFAYWFDFMGLLSWFILFILLILGAYFTIYMPVSDDESYINGSIS